MPEEIWFYLTMVLGVAIVALTVLFLVERERKRYSWSEEKPVRSAITLERVLSTSRSVPDEVVREVKGKLRILDVEREILSYAIRRLYEAQAEGRITPEERDALAKKYKEDLERVKEEIARGETIVALNELERMREEFIKMFSERLEIIDKRIEGLKAMISPKPIEQIKPLRETKIEEVKEQMPVEEEKTEKSVVQRRRREAAKQKSAEEVEGEVKEGAEKPAEEGDVDKSIEKMVAEIERVISKLSQMEAEE